MMKTIIFTARATSQLEALPEAAQVQVLGDLYHYVISGHGDVKKLVGRDGYRLRSGRYRIVFTEDLTTVLTIYVGIRDTTTYR